MFVSLSQCRFCLCKYFLSERPFVFHDVFSFSQYPFFSMTFSCSQYLLLLSMLISQCTFPYSLVIGNSPMEFNISLFEWSIHFFNSLFSFSISFSLSESHFYISQYHFLLHDAYFLNASCVFHLNSLLSFQVYFLLASTRHICFTIKTI